MRSALLVVLAFTACADRAKPSLARYEAGDYSGAAQEADRGLSAHPKDAGLWRMRIRSALALGDRDALVAAYRGYRAHRKNDDRALLRELAIATLTQALASPSARLKIDAIEAIEEVQIGELLEAVIQRLGDADERVATAAGVAVVHDHPDAPQVVDAALRSDNVEARRIAVRGLGRKVGPIAAGELERAARDPEPRVRRAAVDGLGTIKDADGVAVLAQRLRDPDDATRAAAARALAKIGVGDLAAFAKVALADRVRDVRRAGVELYVAARANAELARLADDADPAIAIAAARTPESLRAAVRRAATAEDAEARALAAERADDVALARQLAGDGDVGVRIAAARALARLGDRVAAASVLVAAASGTDDHAIDAAAALAELGDARGLDALSALVADTKRAPESRAAAAAAHRRVRRATPGLVAALADPNALVRVAAAAACASLSRP
jgi:HEAT repeat protein